MGELRYRVPRTLTPEMARTYYDVQKAWDEQECDERLQNMADDLSVDVDQESFERICSEYRRQMSLQEDETCGELFFEACRSVLGRNMLS